MGAKYKEIPLNDLNTLVQESRSYAEVLIKLGYKCSSNGSFEGLKTYLKENNIDTSNLLGQAWNKNNFDYSRFTYGSTIKMTNAKKALVYLRGNKCECCGLTKWNGEDIPLEIHHIDGKHLNNELSNLQLLCPNCHALTDNWRGKNINNNKKDYIREEDFVKALEKAPNIRQALLSLGLSACGGNYARANELIVKYNIKK